MDIKECMLSRRSIRKYQDKDVSDELIQKILQCAINAPSGNNTQPWEFVVVRNKETREKLSKIQNWSSFVANAPVCIVVCLNSKDSISKSSDYFSIACAVQNILLSANSLGLGSVWTYVKDFDDPSVEQRAKEILNIPEDVEVICMLPLGYPDESKGEKSLKSLDSVVHSEKW